MQKAISYWEMRVWISGSVCRCASNSRGILRQAAGDCESWDNTDEALAKAGWPLRRAPGPSQVPVPPVKLTVRAISRPGVLVPRWGRVKNICYYEIKMAVIDS